MALEVTVVEVWAASIEDRPGGLAGKLEALASAGANLEFVVSRRSPEKPGTGVVFVTPIGDAQTAAAEAAGFARSKSLHSLRAAGADAPGLGAQITKALGDAGINLRGLSAAALGGRCVVHLGLDTEDDAAKAAEVLQGL
ncbi:MAG: amino acid-binding protein [Anaerolineaceae bacterium]|nr:amino acid-binding protein [Anaerolineaceae bacterium]